MTLAIAVASRGPRQQLIQVIAGGSLGVIVWLSVAIAVLAGSDVLLLAFLAPAVTAIQTAGDLYLVFLAIRLLRHSAWCPRRGRRGAPATAVCCHRVCAAFPARAASAENASPRDLPR